MDLRVWANFPPGSEQIAGGKPRKLPLLRNACIPPALWHLHGSPGDRRDRARGAVAGHGYVGDGSFRVVFAFDNENAAGLKRIRQRPRDLALMRRAVAPGGTSRHAHGIGRPAGGGDAWLSPPEGAPV
ncbi:FAD-linked oxidase C-terminal domain-containing protein [Tistrella mobilis]|uniref:FAD-linked oxidase C-terminal domain-containing protein n=1 Tax=Tistrella mobilis TaxID=171437 RepID=UPI003557913D